MKTKKPYLSIVATAYNEAGNIEKVIEESAKVAKKITNNFEIIICDDGSTDNTKEIIKRYQKKIPQLKLLVNKKNLGMGSTFIRVLKAAQGEFIQSLPGDYQMRPKEIPKFYKAIQNADLVAGLRINRNYTTSPIIVILSKIYYIFTKLMFSVKIHDLGSIKMIRKSALRKINPKSKTNFIEAELILKAYRQGLRVKEVPINFYQREHGEATGAKPLVVFKIFTDLFKYSLLGKV